MSVDAGEGRISKWYKEVRYNMTIESLKATLEREGLSLVDFSILLFYYEGGDRRTIYTHIRSLRDKKLLKKSSEFTLKLADDADKIIDSWLSEENYVRSESERYLNLAEKLRNLYPEGRKSGTNYMWRDSKMVIAKKLKTLTDKFSVKFTDEEAIEATKRYIESFNGCYQYMQLLKYFILKKDPIKQEETSQLLSFIENEDSVVNYDAGEII